MLQSHTRTHLNIHSVLCDIENCSLCLPVHLCFIYFVSKTFSTNLSISKRKTIHQVCTANLLIRLSTYMKGCRYILLWIPTPYMCTITFTHYTPTFPKSPQEYYFTMCMLHVHLCTFYFWIREHACIIGASLLVSHLMIVTTAHAKSALPSCPCREWEEIMQWAVIVVC